MAKRVVASEVHQGKQAEREGELHYFLRCGEARGSRALQARLNGGAEVATEVFFGMAAGSSRTGCLALLVELQVRDKAPARCRYFITSSLDFHGPSGVV